MKQLFLFALALCLASAGFAQDAAPTGGRSQSGSTRILTRTRTVGIFEALERQLLEAVQKKDKAALTNLTAEDFELRRAATPNTPVARDEFLANELPEYNLRNFRLSDMAVHMYGDTAVVSFHCWQDATVRGQAATGTWFLVDVWTKHGNDWKLGVRYSSPVAGQKSATEDRAPTGKE